MLRIRENPVRIDRLNQFAKTYLFKEVFEMVVKRILYNLVILCDKLINFVHVSEKQRN